MAFPSSSDTNGNAPAFRSILPHEPLPRREQQGYILLQGAFQPRIIKDNDNGKSPSVVNESYCWTRQGLQDWLLVALGPKGQELLKLPSAATHVDVLDAEPPFGKARVTYQSPRDALRMALYCRRRDGLSVAQLMSVFANDNNKNKNNNYNFATIIADNHEYTFSARALQCSRLTQQPRPTPSWGRSSPPKFRRLLPRPNDDQDMEALQRQRQETRFIFVTNLLSLSLGTNNNQDDEHCNDDNVWTEPWKVVEAIRSVMEAFDTTGHGVEVFAAHKKKVSQYCHVGFRSATDAQTAMARLQEQVVTWTWTEEHSLPQRQTATSGKLFLDYAAVTDRSIKKAQLRAEGTEVPRGEPTRSECTSTTAHVHVPGLFVVPDFVSVEEEEILLAVLLGPQAPWAPSQRTPTEGGVVKRRVQHYGYVFDYQTTDVLRDKMAGPTADCPPMPQWTMTSEKGDQKTSCLEHRLAELTEEGRGWPVLAGVIERTRQTTFDTDDEPLRFPNLNQMTLNLYEPGEGIGSHVDTISAFGDGLISLSLQSGIVMEFRLPHNDPTQRKLVYLPPRSLVVMTGPARYEWEHMIVTRRTDTHNGQVIPRGVRVSLTFRTALQKDGTPLPLLESDDFPLQWAQDSTDIDVSATQSAATASLVTPECERRHVHEVYDAIARQWHHTRGRRGVLWPGATQFLQRLPPGSMVADVGCGDGKYFPAIWEASSFVIGTDISRPLLETAFPDELDIPEKELPESRRMRDDRRHLRQRPSVAVADCMNLPLRDHSCDAAICIAVLHHLSTHERRVQCLRELARVVRAGGLINVQAWAMDQEEGSRRKFVTEDVFVPFNAQPKYLDLQSTASFLENGEEQTTLDSRSNAQKYSEAFNAQYDDRKGLVVFKRYCHLYRKGELEELVNHVPSLELVEGGFESGNYFIILQVKSATNGQDD